MFQSFTCTLRNDCKGYENFEEIPTFNGSKLNVIVEHLEPVIYNDTLKIFNENVPSLLKVINATSDVLERETVQTVINGDIFVRDIFTDEDKAKEILTRNQTFFNTTSVDILMETRVRMGMLTGDIISQLNVESLSASILFPYASESLLNHLGHLFDETVSESKQKMREMMLSNIQWSMLVDEYEKFKNNDNLRIVTSLLSDSVNTFSIRRKRQADLTTLILNTTSVNMTEIESMIATLQAMNITSITNMAMSLTEELNNIVTEIENMEDLMSSGQITDVTSMITAFITSPQMAKIAESIAKIIEEMEPMMKDTEYFAMFQEMKTAFQSLNRFFSEFTTNLKLSDIIANWSSIENYALEQEIFSQDILDDLGDTLVSAQIVFTLFNKLELFVCSQESLTRYLELQDDGALANSTCGFIQSDLMIELISVVDTMSAADYFYSVGKLSPANLASSSNMTEQQLEDLMNNLGEAVDIFPRVEELLDGLVDGLNVTTFNFTTISTLFCGAEVFSVDNEKYKVEIIQMNHKFYGHCY